MSDLMRVAICVPSGDMVHADFMMSMVNLTVQSRGAGLGVALLNTKMSHIDTSRYMMVKAAQDVKADYMLFMDSDMVFPSDALIRLLNHGEDIVGAGYVRRRPPHNLVCTDLDGTYPSKVGPDDTGLREMKRIPTGMMLIKMSVFQKVPAPWFDSRWLPEKNMRLSEDNAFCDDARRMGFKVYMDQDLTKEMGHIGQSVYYPDMEEN